MKKLFLIHLLLSLSIITYAQNEKIKEVISKKQDFRIEKVTTFINILDADLKTPHNSTITITNQAGAQVASFTNQSNAKVYLPINDIYQVKINSDKFKQHTATINLKKVKEYEFSETILLQPNKIPIKVAVGDDDTDRNNVLLTAKNKSGLEQVRFTPIPGTNEYQAEIREGDSYQLEVLDYDKNFVYKKDISSANAGSIIQINPDQVGNLSKTQKFTKKDKDLKEEVRNTLDLTKLLASTDDNTFPETNPTTDSTNVSNESKVEETDKKEDSQEEKEPKTFEELLAQTEKQLAEGERELLEKQKEVQKELDQIKVFIENKDLTPEQKKNLEKVADDYEKLIDDYDKQYQALRKQNFEKLTQIRDKIGIPRDFFKEYWYIIIWMAIAILVLFISLIISGVIARNRTKQRNDLAKLNQAINEQKEIIEIERQKSENLLLNILPEMVAEELKTTGKAQMRSYERVSILFTDFKGFTEVAAKMTPERLMSELNDCFTGFDEIIAKHNMEKIKTIGDAYMCAGGIPEPNAINPVDSVLAGLEMQDFMQRRRKERLLEGEEYWQCRLGINTGEIKAGVIGTSKFAYDIWGDPVNIASRMESGGEVNKVNISEETYLLIKDFFECTYRGEVEVKNGLVLKMYFVDRIRPEFSTDAIGIKPNEAFEQMKNERFGQLARLS